MPQGPERGKRVPPADDVKPPPPSAATAQLGFGVFGVALVVRVAYVLSIRHAIFFDHLQTEPQRYDEWAAAIVSGAAPVRPPFDEAPGYPYLLALLYALFGRSVLVVTVAQSLLDAGTCAAIAAVGVRLSGARAGLIAGGLAAVYGPLIYFTGQLEPATLTAFAVSVALYATPGSDEGTARHWSLAGVAWTLALLVRTEIVVALPLLLFHAWRCGRGRALGRIAAAPAALLAASLAINLISSHHVVALTTGSGVNLWLGNNALADGVNPFVHGPLDAVARGVEAQTHDAVEADTLFRSHAFAFFREQPARAAHLAVRKLVWTFSDRELPNASDIEWQVAHSWLFRLRILPLRFGALLPIALAGALMFRGSRRRWLFLAAPVVVGLSVCVVFFTNARFRLVFAPSLLVLGGLAIDRLIDLRPAWRSNAGPLRLAASGVLLGVLAAWSNFEGVRTYRIPQISVNTAEHERQAGNVSGAVAHLRLAVEADPEDAGTWIALALTLEQSDRGAEAEATWRRALDLFPGDLRTHSEAARFFRQRDRGGGTP